MHETPCHFMKHLMVVVCQMGEVQQGPFTCFHHWGNTKYHANLTNCIILCSGSTWLPLLTLTSLGCGLTLCQPHMSRCRSTGAAAFAHSGPWLLLPRGRAVTFTQGSMVVGSCPVQCLGWGVPCSTMQEGSAGKLACPAGSWMWTGWCRAWESQRDKASGFARSSSWLQSKSRGLNEPRGQTVRSWGLAQVNHTKKHVAGKGQELVFSTRLSSLYSILGAVLLCC